MDGQEVCDLNLKAAEFGLCPSFFWSFSLKKAFGFWAAVRYVLLVPDKKILLLEDASA